MRCVPAGLVAAGLLAAGLLSSGAGAGGAPLPGAGPACPLFPADNIWHADVSGLPVHARSAACFASMGGPERRLHPDFGPNDGGQPYGIPYSVVPGSTQKVAVSFDYADESDPGPYPFGTGTPIEGGSDAHALVVDKDPLRSLRALRRRLERRAAHRRVGRDLGSAQQRPAAPGLDVGRRRRPAHPARAAPPRRGGGRRVDHGIRLTASRTDRSFLWPARHHAGAASDPSPADGGVVPAERELRRVPLPARHPGGAAGHAAPRPDRGRQRFQLVLHRYVGPGWDTDLLDQLKTIPAGAFEAVDTSSLLGDADSGRVATSSAPPATTAPTAPTTNTTRPRATTTTTRAKPTTTTTPPATAHDDRDDADGRKIRFGSKEED